MIKESLATKNKLVELMAKKGLLETMMASNSDNERKIKLDGYYVQIYKAIASEIGIGLSKINYATEKQKDFVRGLLHTHGYTMDDYDYEKIESFTHVEVTCIVQALYKYAEVREGREMGNAILFDMLIEDMRISE